tara:strand:+ start:47 stop:268 length:222 start_codon:yes stop_codon:yes gene_type:complete
VSISISWAELTLDLQLDLVGNCKLLLCCLLLLSAAAVCCCWLLLLAVLLLLSVVVDLKRLGRARARSPARSRP